MKTWKSGQKVTYGVYVSTKPFDVRFVGADDETLDGRTGAEYRRIPTLLMVAMAPVLGGVFVMAFPAVVVLLAVVGLGRFAWRQVAGVTGDTAHLAVMRWEPSTSYLKNTTETPADAKPAPDAALSDLRDEVKARRDDEK